MEHEDEEQENEKEDERDGGMHRAGVEEVSSKQQHADDTWMTCARHLELMSRAKLKCVRETRENVTCEGVLFTPLVGCSRLLSAVNDLTTKNRRNSTLSFLMGQHLPVL